MDPMKLHIKPGTAGGLPYMEVYNIIRDPGEKRLAGFLSRFPN